MPHWIDVATGLITTLYIVFGGLGYMSYGDDTEKQITLNLPSGAPLAAC